LPRQIGRQTLLDHFPGFARMIDRLAHHAFGLREDSIAEIDPVKPRLKNFQTDQDFVTPHTNQRVLRIVAAACSAPETSIMIKLSRYSGEKKGRSIGVWAPAVKPRFSIVAMASLRSSVKQSVNMRFPDARSIALTKRLRDSGLAKLS